MNETTPSKTSEYLVKLSQSPLIHLVTTDSDCKLQSVDLIDFTQMGFEIAPIKITFLDVLRHSIQPKFKNNFSFFFFFIPAFPSFVPWNKDKFIRISTLREGFYIR